MEWIEGELLGDYVQRNLGKPAALARLANRWLTMMQALAAADIAHGDLQPGNVLVVNHDFKLIDYDGMFVPSMSGQKSHEVGHRHFQHPTRTLNDFGPTLDHFASWVIYVSLIALSIDPDLWRNTNAGDEALLFQQSDFKSPSSSTTFKLLTTHPNQTIQKLAVQFQSFLPLGPLQTPPLEFQKTARRNPRVKTDGYLTGLWSIFRMSKGPMAMAVVRSSAQPKAISTKSASWVKSFAPETKLKSFSAPNRFAQSIFATTLILISLLVTSIASYPFVSFDFPIVAGGLGFLLALAAAALLTVYFRDPLTIQKRSFYKGAKDSVKKTSTQDAKLEYYREEKLRLSKCTNDLRDSLLGVFTKQRDFLKNRRAKHETRSAKKYGARLRN